MSSRLKETVVRRDRGNAHNAFYCAPGLLRDTPAASAQILLTVGAGLTPKTRGHSLTCFFPVVPERALSTCII